MATQDIRLLYQRMIPWYFGFKQLKNTKRIAEGNRISWPGSEQALGVRQGDSGFIRSWASKSITTEIAHSGFRGMEKLRQLEFRCSAVGQVYHFGENWEKVTHLAMSRRLICLPAVTTYMQPWDAESGLSKASDDGSSLAKRGVGDTGCWLRLILAFIAETNCGLGGCTRPCTSKVSTWVGGARTAIYPRMPVEKVEERLVPVSEKAKTRKEELERRKQVCRTKGGIYA